MGTATADIAFLNSSRLRDFVIAYHSSTCPPSSNFAIFTASHLPLRLATTGPMMGLAEGKLAFAESGIGLDFDGVGPFHSVAIGAIIAIGQRVIRFVEGLFPHIDYVRRVDRVAPT